MSNQILQVTDIAAEEIKNLLAKRGKASLGIKVKVKNGGCNGKKYEIEYADEVNKFDEIIEDKGVKIFIDKEAIMYLFQTFGTTLDFSKSKMEEGFKFINPNAKGECGCGESFNV